MLKRFAKILLMIMFAVPILNACSREPARKVIEYDEEVRLHDGSMIWVRITRHYRRVGALGQGSAYKPTITEISWDTGFPEVGRRSVFFEGIYLIDKYKDEWYVLGYRYPYPDPKELDNGSVNCKAVGSFFRTNYDCLVVIDKQGNLVKKSQEQVEHIDFFRRNIKSPRFTKYPDFSNPEYEGKRTLIPVNLEKFTWNDKLQLEKVQEKRYHVIGKPYQFSQENWK